MKTAKIIGNHWRVPLDWSEDVVVRRSGDKWEVISLPGGKYTHFAGYRFNLDGSSWRGTVNGEENYQDVYILEVSE